MRLTGPRVGDGVQGAVYLECRLRLLPATSGSGIHAAVERSKYAGQASAVGRALRVAHRLVAYLPTAWIPDIPPRLTLPDLRQGEGGIPGRLTGGGVAGAINSLVGFGLRFIRSNGAW